MLGIFGGTGVKHGSPADYREWLPQSRHPEATELGQQPSFVTQFFGGQPPAWLVLRRIQGKPTILGSCSFKTQVSPNPGFDPLHQRDPHRRFFPGLRMFVGYIFGTGFQTGFDPFTKKQPSSLFVFLSGLRIFGGSPIFRVSSCLEPRSRCHRERRIFQAIRVNDRKAFNVVPAQALMELFLAEDASSVIHKRLPPCGERGRARWGRGPFEAAEGGKSS